MRILDFKIINYKGFSKSDTIEIDSGITVVVGQNNAGKTALLEAVSINLIDRPHRSLKTSHSRTVFINGASTVELTIELKPTELVEFNRLSEFYIPRTFSGDAEVTDDFLSTILENSVVIRCTYQNRQVVSANFIHKYISNGFVRYSRNKDGVLTPVEHASIPNQPHNSLAHILSSVLVNYIYIFKAERLNVSESPIQSISELKPDASNLAQVLNYLQSNNPQRFRRLNKLVNKVFPDITDVTVPPVHGGGGNGRVLIWSVDPETEREDLAVSLAESGTGIGQILAILYVVINSDMPRIFFIDEPQSFLHPSAVRMLIDILKTFPQHQYVLTTHSPIIINAAYPCNILHVQRANMESEVTKIDIEQTDNIRKILSDVGVRLSDVFGADRILWVEGQTEELCFKLLIESLVNEKFWGIEVLGVKQVGDLIGKHALTVYDIYDRLSKGKSLLPPAIGFIFDRESRSKQEIEDLERRSKGKAKFLTRKMFENYLLDTDALLYLLKILKIEEVSIDDINTWLITKGREKKYEANMLDVGSTEWQKQVHAAKILEDLINTLSNGKSVYDKVKYGPMLTGWLIKNKPNEFDEIVELLKTI